MFFAGEWRNVTKMFQGQKQVHYPERATACVLEVDDGYVPTLCTPGDVMTNWAPELPDESAWETVN